LIYAGTVHRSQGMTLDRAVVDLRRDFWEHGQLYVALSRITDPRNLCILLPPSTLTENTQAEVEQQATVHQEDVGILIRLTIENDH
jgi:ATP-dependent exoDNAse (exonuclease V) alpha subunit